MKTTMGVMFLLFLGTALPMCADTAPPSAEQLRDHVADGDTSSEYLECLWCGTPGDHSNGVSNLLFRYSGAGAEISVHDGNHVADALLFSGLLADGDVFEVAASDVGADRLANRITFFDASSDELLEIRSNCSEPLVPGTVYPTALGDFELLAGIDDEGTSLCPVLPSCEDCGFGDYDAAGVTSLELLYNGPSTYLAVTNLADPTPLFAGDVMDGDVIVLHADVVGEPVLTSWINFFETPAWVWVGNFNADCNVPLGPGRVITMSTFQLTVTGGEAASGAALCPAQPVP